MKLGQIDSYYGIVGSTENFNQMYSFESIVKYEHTYWMEILELTDETRSFIDSVRVIDSYGQLVTHIYSPIPNRIGTGGSDVNRFLITVRPGAKFELRVRWWFQP